MQRSFCTTWGGLKPHMQQFCSYTQPQSRKWVSSIKKISNLFSIKFQITWSSFFNFLEWMQMKSIDYKDIRIFDYSMWRRCKCSFDYVIHLTFSLQSKSDFIALNSSESIGCPPSISTDKHQELVFCQLITL